VSAPEIPAAGWARSRRLWARALRVAAVFILSDVVFGFLAPRLLARWSDDFGSIELVPERGEELVIQGEPAPGKPLLGRDGAMDFNLDVEALWARIDQGFAGTFRQVAHQEPAATWGKIRYFSPPGSVQASVSCPMNFTARAVDSAKTFELHLKDKREGDLRTLSLTAPGADLRVGLEPLTQPDDPTPNGIGCQRRLIVGDRPLDNFRSLQIVLVVKHDSSLNLTFWRKSWESPMELLDLSELPVRSLRVSTYTGSSRLELVSRAGKADLRVSNLISAGGKLHLTVSGAVLVTGSDVTLSQRPPLALAGLAVLGLLHAWPAVWWVRAFRRRGTGAVPGLDLSMVFISYSHADEAWKDRLVKHLGVLEAEGVLETWDDRRIGLGEDWFPAIEAAMDKARVAVLLVSADFLTSKFIRGTEVPRFLERRRAGLRVIPVIVHPCAWQAVDWLAQIQCRPKDGRPLSTGRKLKAEEDLAALALEIRDLLHPQRVTGE
jgi:hypothetical protein